MHDLVRYQLRDDDLIVGRAGEEVGPQLGFDIGFDYGAADVVDECRTQLLLMGRSALLGSRLRAAHRTSRLGSASLLLLEQIDALVQRLVLFLQIVVGGALLVGEGLVLPCLDGIEHLVHTLCNARTLLFQFFDTLLHSLYFNGLRWNHTMRYAHAAPRATAHHQDVSPGASDRRPHARPRPKSWDKPPTLRWTDHRVWQCA